MTCPIRIFEKFYLTPKSCLFALLKVKFPNMTDWHKFSRYFDTAVLPKMATQTHCLICKNNLRGGGVWCFTCPVYMHVKCSGIARSSDHYDDFSCHRCTSQFHSANDKHECNPPSLATTTLPQMHPHPSTAPLSENSGESSTIESRTIQDPWSNSCPELIETTRKYTRKWSTGNRSL